MSSTHELAGQIDATKDQTDSLAAGISADIQQAEEAKSIFQQVGAESSTSLLEQVESQLEEAQSIRETLAGSLEKARWQVMAVINGVSAGNTTNSRVTKATFTDRTSGSNVQITVSNPWAGRRESKVPDYPELSRVEEVPRSKSSGEKSVSRLVKLGSLGRKSVKNAESLKDYSSEVVKPATQMRDSMELPDPRDYESVTTTPQVSQASPQNPQPAAEDVVGSSIMMAAVLTEGAARVYKRVRNRKHAE